MNKWNKIPLFIFQQIDKINARTIPDIDKTLFSICAVFKLTEHQLDNLGIKKANILGVKMAAIFNEPFNPKKHNRIGRYFINYDISKMTLGQYVELSFFLSNHLQNAHYIMASVSNKWLRKNNSDEHRDKADYFLHQPISKIIGSLSGVMESFNAFNNEYKDLFGLEKSEGGGDEDDQFNKRWGWIYSATQVAEYERITLDDAMKLPVRQAFNGLSFLKAKGKYEAELLNK